MTCLPSLLITEQHEGTLDAEGCAELERHLAVCPACGELRRDLEDLRRLCRESAGEPVRMPETLRARLSGMLAGDPAAAATPGPAAAPGPRLGS